MLKYDTFNQHIDHLRGNDKRPDVEVEAEDEKELAENIEMSRKLGNSPLEPEPKFSKRLLNEMKMELREQTARRVKFPIWKINFRFGWMAYASAVIIVLIFVIWGFGQLNNSNTAQPAQESPLASSKITRGLSAEKPDESDTEIVEKPAPQVVLAESETAKTFAPALEIPQQQDEIDESVDEPTDQPAEPQNEPTGGTLALDGMPTWPDELGQELDSLTNLMDDLESFGSGLDGLEADLDSF